MPLPQAPKRQDTRVLPTPLVGDILFSQIEDSTRKDFPEYGTPHPDTAKWPNHELVYIRAVNNERDGIYEFYYAAVRNNQDEYNWEFTKADIGGQNFDAVARTYVTRRDAFNPLTPAMGATMPVTYVDPVYPSTTPTSLFGSDYVLAQRKQSRIGDQVLESMFVVDVHVYVKRCTTRNIGVDSLNGRRLTESVNLLYKTETAYTTGTSPVVSVSIANAFLDPTNSYWGLQSDGTQRTGKQLSCEWYAVTTETVVSGTAYSGGDTTLTGAIVIDDFFTNDNYSWPPVLQHYEMINWSRRDGGSNIHPVLRFHPEGYRGPCKQRSVRYWRATAFDIPEVVPMLPTSIIYSCPFFSVSIPDCLHGSVSFKADTGTTDPVFKYVVGTERFFQETNYLTWPATIVAFDQQEPYRGGFVRSIRTAYAPTFPAVTEINTPPSAPLPEPYITIEQPALTALPDGGSVNFGSRTVGTNFSLTFTIRNSGTTNLVGLGITITGVAAANYTVTTAPTPPVAPAGTTTFIVRFTPSVAGARVAAMHINSNVSGSRNPYTIALTGTGT
jgi:hypothetical protein